MRTVRLPRPQPRRLGPQPPPPPRLWTAAHPEADKPGSYGWLVTVRTPAGLASHLEYTRRPSSEPVIASALALHGPHLHSVDPDARIV